MSLYRMIMNRMLIHMRLHQLTQGVIEVVNTNHPAMSHMEHTTLKQLLKIH
jgi:Holliday junction resolvasome RuvABC endonuclease subunit